VYALMSKNISALLIDVIVASVKLLFIKNLFKSPFRSSKMAVLRLQTLYENRL
jgi:hypothetical protein